MDSVGFTPEQLEGLLYLAGRVREGESRDDEMLAEIGRAEGEHLAPVYDDLVALYANGKTVTEEQLTPFSKRLEDARVQAYGGTEPRGMHYAAINRLLQLGIRWVETLPMAQQVRLGECRFFLQRRLGPFTNPGDYGKWLGTAWNGADFASLRAGGRPVDEGQMDIGGLWADDAAADQSLPGMRVAVLLLFAIEEDGFVEAIEVRQGKRAPGDYTSSPTKPLAGAPPQR